MTQLSEALTRLNTNKLSGRKIAAEAQKYGYEVSHVTISKYLGGNYTSEPPYEVLKAFAAVFHVPLESLTRISQLPTVQEPFLLPSEADILTYSERAAVLAVVNTFISNRKEIMLAPREDQKSYRLAASSHDLSEDIPEKYGEE